MPLFLILLCGFFVVVAVGVCPHHRLQFGMCVCSWFELFSLHKLYSWNCRFFSGSSFFLFSGSTQSAIVLLRNFYKKREIVCLHYAPSVKAHPTCSLSLSHSSSFCVYVYVCFFSLRIELQYLACSLIHLRFVLCTLHYRLMLLGIHTMNSVQTSCECVNTSLNYLYALWLQLHKTHWNTFMYTYK